MRYRKTPLIFVEHNVKINAISSDLHVLRDEALYDVQFWRNSMHFEQKHLVILLACSQPDGIFGMVNHAAEDLFNKMRHCEAAESGESGLRGKVGQTLKKKKTMLMMMKMKMNKMNIPEA
ncbi:unnamed protein product [Heligmosomoides polygyrus]|uniref:CASPASE_P10 domain-containing protein n=1 Tax=Heligmosomoides polygyrus TaxID=6339 RepID=A0A3P7YFR2_HELPZ|nr:unnamed protein product [Heligmosomoides polygyrus]